MKAFEYIDASSAEAAVKLLPAGMAEEYAGRKVLLKAGGIDLLDQLKERMLEPDRIVNLKSASKDLQYIKVEGSELHIGPLATLAQIAKHEAVLANLPGLAQAAHGAATPQIRNVATIGGNICQRPRCWYFRNAEFPCLKKGGDTCFAKEGENQYHAIFGKGPSYIVHPSNVAPALVAAGAEFDVLGPKGSRVVKAGEFFVLPSENPVIENVLDSDEVITRIRVPAGLKQSAHVELREKQSYDWALVAASAVLKPEGWQVVLGAVAPIPWRAKAAEAALGTKTMTPELAAAAGEAAIQGANPLKYNEYKVDLVKVAVKRALLKAAGMEETA